MLVQSYSDEDYARLFLGDLTVDLSRPRYYLSKEETIERLKIIDEMMHEFGFYRREKWKKTDWGWQAKIRKRKIEEENKSHV